MIRKIPFKKIGRLGLAVLPYAFALGVTIRHLQIEQDFSTHTSFLLDDAKYWRSVAETQQKMLFQVTNQTKQIVDLSEQMQQDAAQAQEYTAYSHMSMEEARKELRQVKEDFNQCRKAMQNAQKKITEVEDIALYFQHQYQACVTKPVRGSL